MITVAAGFAAALSRRGAALAVAGLLTLAGAGSAGQVSGTAAADAPSGPPVAAVPEPRSPGPMQIRQRWRSGAGEPSMRADSAGTSALGRWNDTFRPVAAVVCREAQQRRPDGGTDGTAVEDRPDEFTAAVKQPTWARVATRVLFEVESARAAASGCIDAYADMVWATGLYQAAQPARPDEFSPLAEAAATVRLCVYRVTSSEQGCDKPRGDLVSGGVLPPGRWAAVRQELQTTGPPPACTTPANRFALVETPRGTLFVELDGCRRLLAPAVPPGDGSSFHTLRQTSARLPALLSQP